MDRNVAIIAGVLGGVLAGYFVARSRAVAHPGASTVVIDADAPKSFSMADVADKCRSTSQRFAEDKKSDTLRFGNGVLLRIIPAEMSSKFKYSHLAKGRIIAKIRNEETGQWPNMAIYGKEESCWYVWADDDERLHSKFVRMNGTGEAPDLVFDIQFHEHDHQADGAEWNRKFEAMLETENPFRLAAFRAQGDTTRGTGNTGWTTCLLNGCCRSRQ